MLQNIALATLGLCMVTLAAWALRPRRRVEPSIETNWRQRDGSEMFGASKIDPTLREVDVAIGAAVDAAVGGSH